MTEGYRSEEVNDRQRLPGLYDYKTYKISGEDLSDAIPVPFNQVGYLMCCLLIGRDGCH